ncbi:hypothetical protein [Methanobrevibacter sp.]|uniref:hypothetical protein n=1 Tax=Methanobrevibacter sp. TaxID=66852 RepID=UPI0025FD4326|nr:hypothetical protein [Methanobrevibacter sp.]MBQ2962612.1 hypothetical protein [Methanobrevibacter sp.]
MSSIKDKLNMKIIAAAIIVLLLVIVGLSLFGGIGDNGDLADVKHVDLNAVSYSFNSPPVSVPTSTVDDIYTAQIGFAFSPKEDIEDVSGIKLSNVELTYSNGTVDKIAEGADFDCDSTLLSTHEYAFRGSLKIPQDDVEEACNSATHIKGEIVVDQTNGTELCIGHIDQDL